MGRQLQGMDRPGVRQVPEGSEEQRKMEETGCEVIFITHKTPVVKAYRTLAAIQDTEASVGARQQRRQSDRYTLSTPVLAY